MSIIDKQRIKDYFKQGYSLEGEKYLVSSFVDESNLEELKELLTDQWNEVLSADCDKHQLDHILFRINYQINSMEPKKRKPAFVRFGLWYARIAALLLIPLLVYGGILTYKNFTGIEVNGWAEMKAPPGARIKFLLPDGSTGWLNSGSTIKYDLNFIRNKQVQLSGEAFFDVKHDDKNKFIVKTKYIDIEVKGTAFDVAAYAGEDQIDVTLERGRIILRNEKSNSPIEMIPDEQVNYSISKQTFIKTKVASQNFSAWKEGKLMLRNASLDDLAKQLSRWYNAEVTVQTDKKTDFQYRATFENENLNEVLRLLKLSSLLDYTLKERVVQADGTFSKQKVVLKVKKNQTNINLKKKSL